MSKRARSGGGRSFGRSHPIALTIVVAIAENGVIGHANRLPWRLKSDLKHFRALTWGKPVVMGRKTFASIGKPLAGRTNIVVSRDPTFAAAGIVVAPTLGAALATARGDALRRCADAIAVIGGADLYAQTLPQADRLAVTLVHARREGDVVFPRIDPAAWREVERREHPAGPDDSAGFAVVAFERRGAEPSAPDHNP